LRINFFNTSSRLMLSNTEKIMCPICFEDEQESHVILPCNCSVCADCLRQWLTLKITENQYSIESQVTCILTECKKPYSLQAIYHKMPLQYQRRLDESLLKVYLTREPDVRKCPNHNCNYAGVIKTNQSCKSPLECALCGTTWREKQHYTSYENLLEWWRNKSTKTEEDSSQQWIKNRSKKCPKCHVNIEKNGGCDHMTCKQCGYQFCWVCFWKYPRHNRLKHITLQQLISFLAILAALSIIVFLIYLVGLMPAFKFIFKDLFYPVLLYSFYFIVWAVKLSFFPVLNFIVANGSVLAIVITFCAPRIPLKGRFQSVGVLSAFLGFSLYIDYFSKIIYILKTELIILLIVGVCLLALRGFLALQIRRGRRHHARYLVKQNLQTRPSF